MDGIYAGLGFFSGCNNNCKRCSIAPSKPKGESFDLIAAFRNWKIWVILIAGGDVGEVVRRRYIERSWRVQIVVRELLVVRCDQRACEPYGTCYDRKPHLIECGDVLIQVIGLIVDGLGKASI